MKLRFLKFSLVSCLFLLAFSFTTQTAHAQSRKGRTVRGNLSVGKFNTSVSRFGNYSWGLGRLGSSSRRSSYTPNTFKSINRKHVYIKKGSGGAPRRGLSSAIFRSRRSSPYRNRNIGKRSGRGGIIKRPNLKPTSRVPSHRGGTRKGTAVIGKGTTIKTGTLADGDEKSVADKIAKQDSYYDQFMQPGQAHVECFADYIEAEKEAVAKDDGHIKTLVPDTGGLYQLYMEKGEAFFKKSEYGQANQYFSQAATLSAHAPETMIELMHVNFATATTSYNITGYYLLKSLIKLPELPMLKIHPKRFYSNQADYVTDQVELETFVSKNPRDISGLFVQAYINYLDKDFESFAANLRKANKYCKDKQYKEAFLIFWDAALAEGNVKGKLVDEKTDDKPKTVSNKDANNSEKI